MVGTQSSLHSCCPKPPRGLEPPTSLHVPRDDVMHCHLAAVHSLSWYRRRGLTSAFTLYITVRASFCLDTIGSTETQAVEAEAAPLEADQQMMWIWYLTRLRNTALKVQRNFRIRPISGSFCDNGHHASAAPRPKGQRLRELCWGLPPSLRGQPLPSASRIPSLLGEPRPATLLGALWKPFSAGTAMLVSRELSHIEHLNSIQVGSASC